MGPNIPQMPHNWTLSGHIKRPEAWKFCPFIQPLLLKEADHCDLYPSVQGKDHGATEMKKTRIETRQRQDKDFHEKWEIVGATLRKICRSHGLCPDTGRWQESSLTQRDTKPRCPYTKESNSSQAQLHCRHLLQQVWVWAQSPKLVALSLVLGTTFGTSDEDTTF